jgi:HlyD family secretion protein
MTVTQPIKKKKNNKWIWLLAGIVAALIIFVIIAKSAGWIGEEEGTKVSTAQAEKKTIIETVTANGKIQPEKEVKISSDVPGEIKELYVAEGDSVIAGKLLARIDPELYQSALDRSEASLNNSRAGLANAKARQVQAEAKFNEVESQYNRNKKMHEQKLISEAEFETSRSLYTSAKADVEASRQNVIASQFTVQSLEASVRESKKNLSRTEIFAPVSGIVSKLSVEKGERVVGTSQMAGTEMMRIANLNDMEVSVDVNENDIVKVSIGDTAMIEVDAYTNRKFKGVVTEVANSATSTGATTADQVTNFVVKIRILRSSYADLLAKAGKKKAVFRPGMSASVEIQTEKISDILSIPIEAVTIRDKSELDTNIDNKSKETIKNKTTHSKNDEIEVVFITRNGKVYLQQVRTGIQDDKYIQIQSGLKQNDEVVTGPYSAISKTLKPGTRIRVVSKDELYETKK